MTRDIDVFLPCNALPVDVRHNSKINRQELAEWATKQLSNRTSRCPIPSA
jgi:hypothetical protein